ncbi:MAG: hypothetical protein G01um101413_858 [Parcubacteria group bacterium Gr01-1014_13]|nr:MAG: hypothetical protein G01um101413_858 [Parcubacteria group bacterium Gr01-1014_13]
MLIYRILLIVSVIALVAYLGISAVKKRRRPKKLALDKARTLLEILRDENDLIPLQIQKAPPETYVRMILDSCEEAGITLEKLGTSAEELEKLCEKHKDKKFFYQIGKGLKK